MSTRTLGLIGSAAGGLERVRSCLVEPAIARGWQVAVTLTPAAGSWLDAEGERDRIEAVTGLACRVEPRLPGESSPHPPIDCYLVCPASANTVAKMALGLADNQALTTVCEAIGGQVVPVVVFPRINAAHARQPAWDSHIAALRGAGVHLLMGEEYWPLHEPRSAPGKDLPWERILDAVDLITAGHSSSNTT
ncbi:flavoprotein [Saccharomonospora piscinae]|uniref:Flavoprotein n=1 Tax=Saccharomonospora piscinae TaxID=687388 RepID=A0A1V9A7R2_SACPI|nr:flavoprotein [Saccharomonospora piscinae]OQO93167.1 flavoprotein [Saccharomonospora piscinae]